MEDLILAMFGVDDEIKRLRVKIVAQGLWSRIFGNPGELLITCEEQDMTLTAPIHPANNHAPGTVTVNHVVYRFSGLENTKKETAFLLVILVLSGLMLSYNAFQVSCKECEQEYRLMVDALYSR